MSEIAHAFREALTLRHARSGWAHYTLYPYIARILGTRRFNRDENAAFMAWITGGRMGK